LAALRREIEPVEPEALVRFLPHWQGVGVPRRGLDGLVEVIGILQGAAIPASVFENDVLRVRLLGYRAADLDALCTAGEVVWIGSGSIGGSDGRVRVYFRDQVASLAPVADDAVIDSALHQALLAHLRARGASFWAELVRAASDAGQPYDDTTVLAGLWDLVWAGLVTNDSFAALRAFVSGRSTRAAPRGRPRPGRLARIGPPAGAGRWSLVESLIDPRPDATIATHARALQMAERYGVLTREAALGEGSEGGFAGLYPMLKLLEERGQMRRDYFVAGLGAAQFALPGAVDRLRSPRDADHQPLVLAATDPANPFGASLPWPESGGRPARAAGAFVVLDQGHLVAYLERGGRSILTFPETAANQRWAEALTTLVKDGRLRSLEITRIDTVPARESAHHPALLAAGFVGGYRGLIYRAH
jgi:ATP-dependent Lhr-like helicase